MKDKFSCVNDQAEKNASSEPNETQVDQATTMNNIEYQPEPEQTESDARSEASDFQVDQVPSIGNFDLTDPVLTDGCALHEQSVDSSSVRPPEKAPKKKRSGRPSDAEKEKLFNIFVELATLYGIDLASKHLQLSPKQFADIIARCANKNIHFDVPRHPRICLFSELAAKISNVYPNFAATQLVEFCVEELTLVVNPVSIKLENVS